MNGTGKTVALVVAAGSGSRLGGETPKQYHVLGGKTVLAHAIDRLRHPRIDEIQVVISAGDQQRYDAALADRSLPPPFLGGTTRRLSVRNGLEALASRGDTGTVLIHDAARPLVPPALIDRLLDALDQAPGAVPVLPLPDTLAVADGMLGSIVPRQGVVRVQTPQAFRFQPILDAHRAWSDIDASDDAQMLRAAGGDVAVVPGDKCLEKLTYADDMVRMEHFLKSQMRGCTGLGFDVHRFTAGDHVWLGGVRVPHIHGLEGHSDADVVLHALCDALLGAIGAGDIGDHFPPSDPQWQGASSSIFVERVRAMIESCSARIDHVDVTIICESPRIGPHKQAMRETIAALLRVRETQISIKATTTEGLGFTGRREGIAAQAIASVRRPEDP